MTRDEFDQRVHSAVGGSIDELIEEVRFLSVEYGKQKNHVEDLEHFRKSLIAKLMEEHRERIREHNKTAKAEDKEKATEGRLENLARSDGRYEEFLQSLRQVKKTSSPSQRQNTTPYATS